MLIQITSPTGGTGCSTLTAALATQLSSTHSILVIDLDGTVHDILGLTTTTTPLAAANSQLHLLNAQRNDHIASAIEQHRDEYGFVLIDIGQGNPLDGGVVIGVVTNCYLNLRKWSKDQLRDGVHHYVFQQQKPRALQTHDVEAIVGKLAVTIPFDDNIHRCIDAGTLAYRQPKVLQRPIETLAALLTSEQANA